MVSMHHNPYTYCLYLENSLCSCRWNGREEVLHSCHCCKAQCETQYQRIITKEGPRASALSRRSLAGRETSARASVQAVIASRSRLAQAKDRMQTQIARTLKKGSFGKCFANGFFQMLAFFRSVCTREKALHVFLWD